MADVFHRDFSKNHVSLDISRSRFPLNTKFLGTANAGDLNVCYAEEVLPGDTFNVRAGVLARMMTPIHPVMDDAYIDVEFFFVPWRLTWEHWEEFLGVNKDTFWAQTTTYNIPYLTAPSGGWTKGTLADQFGIPIGIANIKVNALPFRAYGLVYNYFWRNKNLQTAAGINIDDTNRTGSNGTNYVNDIQLGGMPAKSCKLPDLFTRALPAPQKGAAVALPLGSLAPIRTANTDYDSAVQLHWKAITGQTLPTSGASVVSLNHGSNYSGTASRPDSNLGSQEANIYPSNLYADLSTATAASVNQLRLAFATQRILEAQARAGCSYQELLNGLYHVEAGDARLQMPEFLGGARIDVQMSQVLQTSSTDTTSPQGNTAAYSQTISKEPHFVKSFVEHGLVLGVYTIRNKNSYQQGIPRLFQKTSKYDIYFPQMANIGEVAILNKSIYAQGTSADDGVFGYQEAWYEYRDHPNQITGEMRSTYAQSLDSWHYGDDYASLPTLGSTFVQANSANIGRTLAVQGHDQFLVDISIYNDCTRPMPLYSVPGLIDHH